MKVLVSKQLTKQQRAQKVKLLDSKLFASLLHNWRDGGVMHMASRRKQVVLNLVTQTAADEVPEQRPAAEICGGLDLQLRPIDCHLLVGIGFVPASDISANEALRGQ